MTTRSTDPRIRPDRAARPGRALRVSAFGVSLAASLLLSGCSGSGQTPGDAATTQPDATAQAATQAATQAAAAPAGAGATSGPDATGVASASGSLRSGPCRSADLTGSITAGNGGAAGSLEPYLVLTNTGRSSCTLQGYPGVSLVGGGNGTQIGAPATRAASRDVAVVTLQPRHSAHAPIRVGQAGNYDTATCDPKKADGFRVYPPGQKGSLYVAAPGYTGCAKTGVKLLTVQAVQPGTA